MPAKDQSMSLIVMVAVMTLCGGSAYGEGDPQPKNDLPNPYRTIAPWGDLPAGRTWGALNAVAIDNDGESIWSQTGAARIRTSPLENPRLRTTAAPVPPSRRS
jgi:hypothetical protein